MRERRLMPWSMYIFDRSCSFHCLYCLTLPASTIPPTFAESHEYFSYIMPLLRSTLIFNFEFCPSFNSFEFGSAVPHCSTRCDSWISHLLRTRSVGERRVPATNWCSLRASSNACRCSAVCHQAGTLRIGRFSHWRLISLSTSVVVIQACMAAWNCHIR